MFFRYHDLFFFITENLLKNNINLPLSLVTLKKKDMTKSVKDFVRLVEKKNPNEPEFLQAVEEVAETVIPFINNNSKYQNKLL